MTKRQTTRFKKVLLAKQTELSEKIRKKRSTLELRVGGDAMDRANTVADRDVAIENLDLDLALLRRVRGALREIEEGTFGECARCEKRIEIRRLGAVPWSAYCVRCQEVLERQEAA